MPKLQDLSGQKFNNLTVLYCTKSQHQKYYMCRCDCGKEIEVVSSNLKNGNSKSCGCIRRKYRPQDYIGQIFDRLEVIGVGGKNKYGQNFLQCKCICGNIIERRREDLVRDRVQSCGCALIDYHNSLRYDYGNISSTFWHSVIKNAKQRKIDFNIDIKYADSIFEQQNSMCALSGKLLSVRPRGRSDRSKYNGSIDRINSNIGYVEGNIQWVDKTINKMKNDLDIKAFLYYCCCIGQNVDVISNSINLNKYNKNYKGCGNISQKYFGDIKRSAKIRNYDFNLDIKFLWNLFVEQRGKCAITGIPIYFKGDNCKKNASLDRINNNEGYVKDNIHWVHKDINLIKWKLDLKELKNISKNIVKYNNLENFKTKVWGLTQNIFTGPSSEIHIFKPLKSGKCSRHFHQFKHNRFFVIEGKLKINIYGNDKRSFIIGPGETCDVPPKVYHDFEALENTYGLEIYWVDNILQEDIQRENVGIMQASSFRQK